MRGFKYVRRGLQISNSLYATHGSTWLVQRHFIGVPSATTKIGKTRVVARKAVG
jgi:hypothetical protein